MLFDEIEKAHPDVFNVLLQVLEDGRLTDGHGRTVDFSNTLVIMTSNLGTGELGRPAFGFATESSKPNESIRMRSSIEDALKKTFRPEFLNRIDEIIIFEPLTPEQIQQIVGLMVKEVEERLAAHGVAIDVTAQATEWLAKEGFDPTYGARPLRRAIQRYIENPLSKEILAGQFQAGDEIIVDAGDEELTFAKTKPAVEVAAEA